MGKPTASSIALSRIRHIVNHERADLFCRSCTAYIGGAPRAQAAHNDRCSGDPVQHVRDIHPKSELEN